MVFFHNIPQFVFAVPSLSPVVIASSVSPSVRNVCVLYGLSTKFIIEGARDDRRRQMSRLKRAAAQKHKREEASSTE